MGLIQKIFSAMGWSAAKKSGAPDGLMTLTEKRELETLVRDLLFAYHDANGKASLIEPSVFVVLDADGPRMEREIPAPHTYLAYIETQELPSARALNAVAHEHMVVPRDAIKHLGTEATSALAHKINQIADPHE